MEVEKQKWEAKQNLEVEKDTSPDLEAESNPQVCKPLQKIKGCEDVEADKNAAEKRLQKVG